MTDLLQEQIEDYVIGVMSEIDKVSFEEKIKSDSQLQRQVSETQLLREILIRSRIRSNINAVRKEIKAPSKGRGIMLTLGSFAAAASILLFMLSSPLVLTSHEFSYRGESTSVSPITQSRANDFEHAQALINKGTNPKEAIKLLEPLAYNSEVSSNYQRNSKWMLVIAYLQTDEPDKAEKVFGEIKCEGDECPYSFWEKTKVKWQIFWAKH
ncbi:hypothetical protein Emtol_2876 [Emticicia oligotrophica DSM 17448]|uniref:Tetratricopeptide repeat protein n=1 Tax=Emticicia oligotrophica (strain DSM 17448 / CIP 109782 / MTCC 6937 / GPTSA100-15) TaxID=929562 RepID=A0ABN4ANV7_EMTOG|nr:MULTISPECIES: hypothetical protein [Emticicia]AFK04009.1 hypothetical protein Emtol_2876 [Emticicia oligotrophica DSM 17448]